MIQETKLNKEEDNKLEKKMGQLEAMRKSIEETYNRETEIDRLVDKLAESNSLSERKELAKQLKELRGLNKKDKVPTKDKNRNNKEER